MNKYQLFQGNNLDVLVRLEPAKVIFADPPDNQDLGYGEYKDKMPTDEYEALLEQWLRLFVDKAEIVWFSFNARWTTAVGSILHRMMQERQAAFDAAGKSATHPLIECKPCVQVFTFGQHNKHDLGNNHRPLWRISHVGAKLYPDAIKVPSWRQRNGDKRAAPGGRVPGDVFDMQYPDYRDPRAWIETIANRLAANAGADYSDSIDILASAMEHCGIQSGDVFDFPRVTGNSKQRCDWHPTQLHEELVKRCILLGTTDTDRVIDPFGGTGTTLRVCREIGRDCTLIELDANYCREIAKANDLKPAGKNTWLNF